MLFLSTFEIDLLKRFHAAINPAADAAKSMGTALRLISNEQDIRLQRIHVRSDAEDINLLVGKARLKAVDLQSLS